MIDALPPPHILTRLAGPSSHCVVSIQHTDAETGDPTEAQCGARRYLIARDHHGESVRRVRRCAVMLMVEGVRFPRLFAVSNCRRRLEVRNVGEGWTRGLLASARIAPGRLDRVMYYPVAHRPSCYRVSIMFSRREGGRILLWASDRRHAAIGALERGRIRCSVEPIVWASN